MKKLSSAQKKLATVSSDFLKSLEEASQQKTLELKQNIDKNDENFFKILSNLIMVGRNIQLEINAIISNFVPTNLTMYGQTPFIITQLDREVTNMLHWDCKEPVFNRILSNLAKYGLVEFITPLKVRLTPDGLKIKNAIISFFQFYVKPLEKMGLNFTDLNKNLAPMASFFGGNQTWAYRHRNKRRYLVKIEPKSNFTKNIPSQMSLI